MMTMQTKNAPSAIGSPLERLIPELQREIHRGHVEKAMRNGSLTQPLMKQLEVVGRRADGSEFPLESTLSRTLIGGKTQLTAVLRDITERRRAEAEQRETNRQLRQLSASLQNVREQERARIARELHDDLGQQLTGLKLDLSWLNNRLVENRPAPRDRLAAMRRLLDAAISAVRRISVELRPFVLDDLGFGEAVAWQTGEFSRRSGIAVKLDLQAADRVNDNALAIALFRIVQESLTNVLRHADATQVEIGLVADAEDLVLTVVDNGKGMPTTPRARNGMGLLSMGERATALGGRFSIGGQPGGGTAIEVRVPSVPILPGVNA
jgi:signal transduction histidine kinase